MLFASVDLLKSRANRCPSFTPCPQYLGERHVFAQRQYNTMLTGFAFVSRGLLDLYWSDRYAQGGLGG